MGLQRIFLPMFGNANDKLSLDGAFALANACKAHVDACLVRPDVKDAYPYLELGASFLDEIRGKIELHAESTGKQTGVKSRRQFSRACRKWGVRKITHAGKHKFASGHWTDIVGRPNLEIPRLAMLSDITVLAGPVAKDDGLVPGVLERTLLHSGRPLFFMPSGSKVRSMETAVIAWDASVPAARAAAAARPLLKGIRTIEVLSFKELYSQTADPSQLVEYLAWHGLPSRGRILTKNQNSTADALILAAAERDADILIMGGFGHSRFEEIILGGTTRDVLQRSTLPILMMH